MHMDEQEDLRDLTEEQVHDLEDHYRERRALHKTVAEWAVGLKAAIEALLVDGYPEEPMVEVDHEVIEDLDQNTEAINYARSRFKVRPLTTSGTFQARPQQAPSEYLPTEPQVVRSHGSVELAEGTSFVFDG